MISYRTFRNSDPPHLARIWKAAAEVDGALRALDVNLLDELVFSKSYFDPHGLFIAVDDGRPVGFAHAGFGPAEDLSHLDERCGVVSMLVIEERIDKAVLGVQLLQRCEAYLREHKAERMYAIGYGMISPFYLGLYGGSELPGVLATDDERLTFFQKHGYAEVDRVSVMLCDLTGFRPKVGRVELQMRRSMSVEVVEDAAPANWWEACRRGSFEKIQFQMRPRAGGNSVATATFWNIEPLTGSWCNEPLGLGPVKTKDGQSEMAPFLIGEALKQLSLKRFPSVEAQVLQSDPAAAGVFENLGFSQSREGIALCK